ncbi:DUF2345 domain-containing protein, partial [Acinetobacter sp. Ver3]|uniref:DUF2345 domain-containing protein n=2 Tax=unclassified Acinetobacter TaxID=196816 RepID=UPI000551FD7D
RKGVQIISTEDTIYITSPNEINLTAGGSQVKLNGSGVFPTTGGKFEAKAGQHKFTSPASVNLPALNLPDCSAKQGQAAELGSAKVIL